MECFVLGSFGEFELIEVNKTGAVCFGQNIKCENVAVARVNFSIFVSDQTMIHLLVFAHEHVVHAALHFNNLAGRKSVGFAMGCCAGFLVRAFHQTVNCSGFFIEPVLMIHHSIFFLDGQISQVCFPGILHGKLTHKMNIHV